MQGDGHGRVMGACNGFASLNKDSTKTRARLHLFGWPL